MIFTEATAGPTVTDWAQTIVTILGIVIAASVAVRVAAKQHERQVIHQTKKDVADALVTYELIKQSFFEVKLMAEFATGDSAGLEDHEREELTEVVQRIAEPLRQLESSVLLLELTAPKMIAKHGRNLLHEVRKFKELIMISYHAYVRYNIKRKIGEPEPLRRLTTQAEYEAPWTRLEFAEGLLVLATKEYEKFTSPTHRTKTFLVSLWFRGTGFARKHWKRATNRATESGPTQG